MVWNIIMVTNNLYILFLFYCFRNNMYTKTITSLKQQEKWTVKCDLTEFTRQNLFKILTENVLTYKSV